MPIAAALVALLAPAPARAQVTAAPGYAARSIPMPGGATVQGGVVRRGASILVGQGTTFSAGAQSIVRFAEGGPATTVATGFNSLGGTALGADGTLYVTDNCFTAGFEDCGPTVTGDTVYAIPDALTRTMPIAAVDAEILPAGAIEGAGDVLVAPDGALVVSDFALARVVRVAGNPPAATDLVTGLDIAAGLARSSDGTLLVGNCVFDINTFTCNPGEVREYDFDGTGLGLLTDQLAGVFFIEPDADGFLLVSGAGPFLASRVDTVAADGTVGNRAGGFAFSGDLFFDADRDETLVLDSEATAIAAICRERDGDGLCDADDNCRDDANPGQADADADGLGDACDPCMGAELLRAKLMVGRLQAPPADETFALMGEMTVPTAPAIDPVTTGLRVFVRTARDTVVDAVLPPGAYNPATRTGWKSRRGKFKYQGPGGMLGSAQANVLTYSRSPGLVKVMVRGRGGTIALDAARPPVAASALLDPGAAQCGEAAFAGGPDPACRTIGRGKGVKCG